MQQSRKQSKEDKKWILCVLSLSLVSEGYGKNEYIIYHIHGFLEDMYYGKSPAEKSPAEKSPAEKSYAEKSPAEKSYAEKSPAASDGRGFFSVCDSRFFIQQEFYTFYSRSGN
jgi:hypothetical protein